MAGYDVFLSHSSAQKPWVEALARNLKRAGKTVFLDAWELKPGRHWIEELDAGIDASRAAVLVVSPEAVESGWVRDEYEKLKRRGNDRSEFLIIPVIHSTVAGDLPFIGNIHYVDFRAPEAYRSAFARLLCGLEDRTPGEAPRYEGELDIPGEHVAVAAPSAGDKVDETRDRLLRRRIVTVLARGGVSLAEIAGEMRRHAIDEVGADNVVHIATPFTDAADGLDGFFANLAAQAGFGDDVADQQAFLARVDGHLQAPAPLVMLVTSFEHAAPEAQSKLCGVLRTLSQRHDRLRILLFGGQKLNELKYAQGDLSMLSHADEVPWPDPSPAEIGRAVAGDDGEFTGEELAAAADLGGGHPAITRELLGAVREDGASREGLEAALQASPALWAALMPLARDPGALDRLGEIAAESDLGPSLPYLPDPTCRRLFWEGLVVEVPGRRLAWRTPAVREAVQAFLAAVR